ncbi:MAG: GGDEF domain-containing protein [Chloroflexota bacterium]|nr:GGDEF domain-containing protein [Chloroflexota bacterium]
MALTIGRDEAVGLLLVGHALPTPRGFTNLCQRLGRSVADAAEVILEQALAHELLATQRDQFALQARTDGLTGLANRTAWIESLRSEEARRARAARPLAVMMADVDHLKLVNDECGHAAGDRLLIATADVLRTATRAGDLVARLGGDEFGMLLVDAELNTALDVAARVQEVAAAWSDGDGGPRLRLSTGCAVPQPGESIDAALARADGLLGSAKRAR